MCYAFDAFKSLVTQKTLNDQKLKVLRMRKVKVMMDAMIEVISA